MFKKHGFQTHDIDIKSGVKINNNMTINRIYFDDKVNFAGF